MKLSEQTIEVLQNFAPINQSLLFKKGDKLRTVSPQKTVLAEVTVPENVGDAFVASPRLFASVKSPNVSQPLFELFLIFNKFVEVSTHIL